MARKNAVTAAKEKAVNMVKDLGQNVGKAINIQGNDVSQDSYYGNTSMMNSNVNVGTNVNNSNSGNAKSKSLNSNLDISYTAVVTFELD